MNIDINNISTKLKERFCKDCNIPINIFQEPYFSDRLKLYNEFYLTRTKWARFIYSIEQYHTEQDYFEDYNRIKDEAIYFIKSSEAYQAFNEENMNDYAIVNTGLPSKDIFRPSNEGKTFISIDMSQANFSALSFYNTEIFDHEYTWESFMEKFTDNDHIIHSKYIRQVILGNCNPSRYITYEKYLMDMILTGLLDAGLCTKDNVVFFSNDEIVIDVSDIEYIDQLVLGINIKKLLANKPIPLKTELFKLNRINGTKGYYKLILGTRKIDVKFKCVDSLYLPFIIREWKKEKITDLDKTFYHNGLLAQFIEVPEISF